MTRREALLSCIAGPFTAKRLAKLPAMAVTPVVATPVATPAAAITFIASGAVCSEQILKDVQRLWKDARVL